MTSIPQLCAATASMEVVQLCEVQTKFIIPYNKNRFWKPYESLFQFYLAFTLQREEKKKRVKGSSYEISV